MGEGQIPHIFFRGKSKNYNIRNIFVVAIVVFIVSFVVVVCWICLFVCCCCFDEDIFLVSIGRCVIKLWMLSRESKYNTARHSNPASRYPPPPPPIIQLYYKQIVNK